MSGSAIRVIALPDLGTVTDAGSFVADQNVSTGRFSAPAIRSYVWSGPVNLAGLPQAQPDGSPPAGAIKGDLYINGGFICVAQ
jgi:hypothetical protein